MSCLFYISLLMLFGSYTFGQVSVNVNTCGKATNTEDDDTPPQTTQAKPKDCQDIWDNGFTETGVYTIYPDGTAGFQVRCDMDDESGAWTVFQRRISDSDFYKTWVEYKYGFGDLTENFWLGNHQLHIITSQGWYQLRVDMEHPNGTTAYAEYMEFKISGEDNNYGLFVADYDGNAGDTLSGKSGQAFSTRDRDNDNDDSNCAVRYHGAWWYTRCHSSNLNGDYGNTNYAMGLTWRPFTTYYTSLSKTEMKTRRFIQRPPRITVDSGNTSINPEP